MSNPIEVATHQGASLPSGVVQFVPTVERILYGVGIAEAHVGAEVARLGGERVLILMPRSLERSLLAAGVRAALGTRLAGDFARPLEHVPLEGAIAAAAAARRCRADLVVALGGGSVIDTGKALRACLAAGITSPEALGTFMEHPVPPEGTWIPQVSIPTTLSGSEYTRSFSATDFTRGLKRSYTHSAVASRIILYDPVATLETPMSLWLASGVMAIDHAVEVFCGSPKHLVGDTLKLASLQELLTYLPRTLEAPEDLEARLRCQVAAWQADHSPLRAQPLAPVTVALHSHALAYELGALCRVPYGISACVTLPACLRWCAAHLPQAASRQAVLARSLGLVSPEGSDSDAAQHLADGLEALIKRLGLPTRLRDVGVAPQDLQRTAHQFTVRGAVPAGAGASTEIEVLMLLESAW